MYSPLRLLALISALLLTAACTTDDSSTEPDDQTQASATSEEEAEEPQAEEPQAEPEAGATNRAGRIQAATEKACNTTFDCAIAEVPESMRSVLNKDQICGAFRGYANNFTIDTVTRPCFRAALDYLNCVGDASCEEITNSDAGPCEEESQRAQARCEGAQ